MPKQLHLCFVADATNIHVHRWLNYFISRGHRITCLSDKGGQIPGANVINIPNRDSLLANGKKATKMDVLKARSKAIKRVLKEVKPDVLHAIFLYQRGWSAAYTAFHPLVITLLGSDIYLPRKNYRNRSQLRRDKWINAISMAQADLITGVSDDLCKVAIRKTDHLNNIELIPIGTDLELFMPGLDIQPLRQKLNIPNAAYVVLSPRQMTPLYNQETIIQSIPKVLQEVPNAVFILKDTFCNTDERKAYVKGLHEMADRLGVQHAIRWEAQVAMEELPLFYNLADVIVSVPSTDGMPVTIFEAMACRKPLIVGDLPSYNEVIIHGQTGLRVPVRNHQALAQAIVKMAKNQNELVDRMVDESQLILQQYGVFEQQMQRMERYYFALKNKRIQAPNDWNKVMGGACFKLLAAFT